MALSSHAVFRNDLRVIRDYAKRAAELRSVLKEADSPGKAVRVESMRADLARGARFYDSAILRTTAYRRGTTVYPFAFPPPPAEIVRMMGRY